MEIMNNIALSVCHEVIDPVASRKPCDVCGEELGDTYQLETEPFQLTLTRYCSECKP